MTLGPNVDFLLVSSGLPAKDLAEVREEEEEEGEKNKNLLLSGWRHWLLIKVVSGRE